MIRSTAPSGKYNTGLKNYNLAVPITTAKIALASIHTKANTYD